MAIPPGRWNRPIDPGRWNIPPLCVPRPCNNYCAWKLPRGLVTEGTKVMEPSMIMMTTTTTAPTMTRKPAASKKRSRHHPIIILRNGSNVANHIFYYRDHCDNEEIFPLSKWPCNPTSQRGGMSPQRRTRESHPAHQNRFNLRGGCKTLIFIKSIDFLDRARNKSYNYHQNSGAQQFSYDISSW